MEPTMSQITVHGDVAAEYEPLRKEFEAIAAEEPGYAAQLAVFAHGELVADLWAGDDMTADSLTGLYSITKGAAHLVVALLVQDGVLELDRTVASIWPEFTGGGKEMLTLRDLLAHRAGLIGVDGGFSLAELADDRRLAARLAGQHPFWRPAEGYGYHAFVVGALTGEVVRRVTGSTIQEIFERRIREPYGLHLYLGLPESQEARYLPVQPMLLTAEQEAELAAQRPDPASLTAIAFNLNASPATPITDLANSRQVRLLGQASAGGVGNARGVATMYAAVIGELHGQPPLLTPATIAEFTARHSGDQTDLVTGQRSHFLLGFENSSAQYPALRSSAFGHGGATGSLSFADPDSGVSYAYVRRRFLLGAGGGAPENERLIGAAMTAAAGPAGVRPSGAETSVR
jgi:CubicO group peptidase (beta-lactamase class C family)